MRAHVVKVYIEDASRKLKLLKCIIITCEKHSMIYAEKRKEKEMV